MRLSAAIIPPVTHREELHDVVTAVEPGTSELDITPVDKMLIPVSNFGNVTQRDFELMMQTLQGEARQWPRPEISFGGSAALEFEGDVSVWSRIMGDLDDLFTVGRGVPVAVKRLGFLVDRRRFRPWLSVGSITDSTTAPYLEKLVEALDAYRGDTWTLEKLSIIRRLPVDETGQVEDVVIEEVPLGGS